mmetsp:Transcript_50189/g.42364  ORF Transcript_50189/g.42364 Transcript_50189/m.42364 type:complete len:234 (-) Transcript_50189:542-1243(-)
MNNLNQFPVRKGSNQNLNYKLDNHDNHGSTILSNKVIKHKLNLDYKADNEHNVNSNSNHRDSLLLKIHSKRNSAENDDSVDYEYSPKMFLDPLTTIMETGQSLSSNNVSNLSYKNNLLSVNLNIDIEEVSIGDDKSFIMFDTNQTDRVINNNLLQTSKTRQPTNNIILTHEDTLITSSEEQKRSIFEDKSGTMNSNISVSSAPGINLTINTFNSSFLGLNKSNSSLKDISHVS